MSAAGQSGEFSPAQLAMQVRHRFGLGPGPADGVVDEPQQWLHGQVQRGQVQVQRLPAQAQRGQEQAPLPAAFSALESTAVILPELQRVRREQRRNDNAGMKLRDVVAPRYRRGVLMRYRAAVESDAPFIERLVHFWSNHFAISADKLGLGAIACSYEQEAIRPHVTGRFADMLRAVVRHPAMLLYLDNAQSIGPQSVLGKRAARRERQLGLNENLAREILELHTLGVDGGYTQADVAQLAAGITGWSVASAEGPLAGGTPGQFLFREQAHEPGARELLGRRYEDNGAAQGEAMLRDLAVHPATARHLAGKLLRHFLGDVFFATNRDEAQRHIEKMAQDFLDRDGELTALYDALISSPWIGSAPLQKLKSPHELLIATYRLLGVLPERAELLLAALDTMGQRPWTPGSPAGFADSDARWGGADALLNRIEWLHQVAQRSAAYFSPADLLERALGPLADAHLRTAVARAPDAVSGLTLLLASPQFQRR